MDYPLIPQRIVLRVGGCTTTTRAWPLVNSEGAADLCDCGHRIVDVLQGHEGDPRGHNSGPPAAAL